MSRGNGWTARGRKERALETLTEFMPASLRREMLERVLEVVGNRPDALAECAGLDVEDVTVSGASLSAPRFARVLLVGLTTPTPAREWMRDAIATRMLSPVQRACAELGIGPPLDLDELAGRLTPLARDVLAYLSRRRHATLQEIASACGSNDHPALLEVLKHEINAAASCSSHLVRFYRSRLDPESGRKVLFSWWFMPQTTCQQPMRLEPADGESRTTREEAAGDTLPWN